LISALRFLERSTCSSRIYCSW